jgi:pimeloyl-ACP methyl ester carboxylesterase
VLCIDEFGPLNLQPRPGKGWFRTGHPTRQRATFHRTAGVRQMFAALDLATGEIFYRFRVPVPHRVAGESGRGPGIPRRRAVPAGYAFSTPLAATGWTMSHTARAWVELMRRLGYQRYGVHGGDVGAGVSGMVASLDGAHVTGMHVVTDPLTAANTATFLPGMADQLDENDPVDKVILARMAEFTQEGSGYLAIQNSRPQTIGYGLVDSPLLQLAWIAEKFEEWTDLPIDRDQLLTTVSLYWFTGSGATAAHSLYEQAHSSDWGAPPAVPQAFAVFGTDETVRKLVPAPPDAHWTEFARGKHFPAMEAPTQLASDLQAFFGPLH